MSEFKETPRQSVIVYLYRLRNSHLLRKFGQIIYTSRRMKYVVIYMNQKDVAQNVDRLRKLRFVKHVEMSMRPFIKVDYADDDQAERYEMTEEDREKFKKTKSESK